VAAFLERHPEFHREPVRGPEPTAHTTEPLAPMPTTPDGDYLSLPQHTGMDGAYAARLRRRAE